MTNFTKDCFFQQDEYTILVDIERHSQLERQEAQFGHTMVIFDKFS